MKACFRRKIMYHKEMHLHSLSLKKRLAPSSSKPRNYFFKKVSLAALNHIYVFLILTRGFLLQKWRLVFYDIIYVIIYDIYFMLAFLLFSLWIEWASRNCLLHWLQKYVHIFSKATLFSSTQRQIFLTFHQVSIKYCLGVT